MLKDTLNGFPLCNNLKQWQRLQKKKKSFLIDYFKCSKLGVKCEEVPTPPHTTLWVRKINENKKNAYSRNVDTKHCTFCTLNLYKCLFFMFKFFSNVKRDYCSQQRNESRCTRQASSSFWCQQTTLSEEPENNSIYHAPDFIHHLNVILSWSAAEATT